MISAADAVVWVNNDTYEIKIMPQSAGRIPDDDPNCQKGYWCDPIGAAYIEWRNSTNDQRMRLMTETAIDLAMQGFPLKDVLTAFAQVVEFKALGSKSYPMARALTSALVGKCLEPNTMSFEDLLQTYGAH